MKKSEIVFGALRLPIDYLATLAAFMLAYFLRPITDLIPGVQYTFQPELLPPMDEYIRFAIVASAFLILLFVGGNLYSLKITRRYMREMFKIIFWVSAWLMFIIAYYFLVIHQLFFSRIALAHIWFFAIAFVIAGRVLVLLIQHILLRFNIGRRRVLFIGVSDLADRFCLSLKKDSCYQVLGALASPMRSRKRDKLQIIGTLDQLESIVKKRGVEEIIQADPGATDEMSRQLLAFCRAHQIRYHFIPDLVRLQRANVDVEMIEEVPLISLKQTPLDGWGTIYKRLFDFLFSLILVIVLIPVWIVVAVLIKLDSPGSVIFKSQRQYRDKIFNVYKFRSMEEGAHLSWGMLRRLSERKGPLFKIKQDPRVTRLGRFLRKSSIDELPQLFNVLIGHISLVGPRPHLPEEVREYQAKHLEVFAIKPGLTGLAQISGRSDLSFDEEVRLDTYYIENWSLWMDIKIIFKTIRVPFSGGGC